MENTRNIEMERSFLMNQFPKMADRTSKATDLAITIAYDMLQLEDDDLEEFGEFLKAKVK